MKKRFPIAGILALIVALGLFSGCQHSLSPAELAAWMRQAEHGLIQEQTSDLFFFRAEYIPLDHKVVLDLREEQISPVAYQQAKLSLQDMEYVNFHLGLLDHQNLLRGLAQGNEALYEQLQQQLAFGMQGHFVLVAGNDTLDCTLAHFEQHFGALPHESLNLAFARTEPVEPDAPRTLLFRNVLQQGEILEFDFTTQTLAALPTLKLEE